MSASWTPSPFCRLIDLEIEQVELGQLCRRESRRHPPIGPSLAFRHFHDLIRRFVLPFFFFLCLLFVVVSFGPSSLVKTVEHGPLSRPRSPLGLPNHGMVSHVWMDPLGHSIWWLFLWVCGPIQQLVEALPNEYQLLHAAPNQLVEMPEYPALSLQWPRGSGPVGGPPVRIRSRALCFCPRIGTILGIPCRDQLLSRSVHSHTLSVDGWVGGDLPACASSSSFPQPLAPLRSSGHCCSVASLLDVFMSPPRAPPSPSATAGKHATRGGGDPIWLLKPGQCCQTAVDRRLPGLLWALGSKGAEAEIIHSSAAARQSFPLCPISYSLFLNFYFYFYFYFYLYLYLCFYFSHSYSFPPQFQLGATCCR